MDNVIRIILIKFFTILICMMIYIGFMFLYAAPLITQTVFAQSAFDVPNQFNQAPSQFQYDQYNQYQQQQYQQPQYNQYDQFNQQPYYQQPYQQYGTPTYSPYGMQQTPPPYQSNTVLGFGIQEIVTALIAGGGATAYARRRTNSLEQDKQLIMSEMLKDKQRLAELARVSYEKMPQKGFEIQDAPSVKLENLNKEIDQFTDKTAKA